MCHVIARITNALVRVQQCCISIRLGIEPDTQYSYVSGWSPLKGPNSNIQHCSMIKVKWAGRRTLHFFLDLNDLTACIFRKQTDFWKFSLSEFVNEPTAIFYITFLAISPNSILSILDQDRKSTRLNSSHPSRSRMPSSA